MRKKLTASAWMALGAAAIVIATASPARADQKVVAKVPFDFIVGASRLPAGNYVVTELDDPAVVSIASTDGRYFTFVLTIAASPDEAAPSPELVFDRFGEQHFLAKIVVDASEGREIPLTPATMEREVDGVAVTSYR